VVVSVFVLAGQRSTPRCCKGRQYHLRVSSFLTLLACSTIADYGGTAAAGGQPLEYPHQKEEEVSHDHEEELEEAKEEEAQEGANANEPGEAKSSPCRSRNPPPTEQQQAQQLAPPSSLRNKRLGCKLHTLF
jgi:hypothetical protein